MYICSMEKEKYFLDGYAPLEKFECTCCAMCKHFDGVNKGTCPAYPSGIPDKYAIRNIYGAMIVHIDVEPEQEGLFTFSVRQ